MHDRFRILTLKRPLPERSEAKEIFLVPTDAAQNQIIGPDLSEPSAYLPSYCWMSGKLGQTSTNFQVNRGKSASIMGIDDSLPGNAAPHLEFFD